MSTLASPRAPPAGDSCMGTPSIIDESSNSEADHSGSEAGARHRTRTARRTSKSGKMSVLVRHWQSANADQPRCVACTVGNGDTAQDVLRSALAACGAADGAEGLSEAILLYRGRRLPSHEPLHGVVPGGATLSLQVPAPGGAPGEPPMHFTAPSPPPQSPDDAPAPRPQRAAIMGHPLSLVHQRPRCVASSSSASPSAPEAPPQRPASGGNGGAGRGITLAKQYRSETPGEQPVGALWDATSVQSSSWTAGERTRRAEVSLQLRGADRDRDRDNESSEQPRDPPQSPLLAEEPLGDVLEGVRGLLKQAGDGLRPLIDQVLATRKQGNAADAKAVLRAEEIKAVLTEALVDIINLGDRVRRAVPYAGTGKVSSKRLAVEDEAPPQHPFGDLWSGAVEKPFEEAVRAGLPQPSEQYFVCVAEGRYYGRFTDNPAAFAERKLRRPMEPTDFQPLSADWVVGAVQKHPQGRQLPHTVLYTFFSPFCYEANAAMRALGQTGATPSSDPRFRCWQPYAFNLQKELHRTPPFTGLTFRAASVRHAVHDTRPGAVITLYAPTSSAAVPNAIKPFLGEHDGAPSGTIYIMHSLNGRFIAGQSECPWEEEVLHMPGRCFRVVPNTVGPGIRSLLGHALLFNLDNVDIVEMKEVALLHWRDAVACMSDAELLRNTDVAHLIQGESCSFSNMTVMGTAEAVALDPVTREEVKHRTGPMTRLPRGRSGNGSTILHMAAAKPNNDTVFRVLLHSLPPSEVNALDGIGRTCLAVAATLPGNELAIAHILLRGGDTGRLPPALADVAVAAAVQQLPYQAAARVTAAAGGDQSTVMLSDLRTAAGAPGWFRRFGVALRACAAKGPKRAALALVDCLAAASGGKQYLDCSGVLAAAASSPQCEPGLLTELFKIAEVAGMEAEARQEVPVARAVLAGNARLIPELCSLGCDVNEVLPGYDRGPPLHCAVRCNDREAVRILGEAGADMGIRHDVGGRSWEQGFAATLVAAVDGLPGMMRALIKAGADIEARNWYNQTALHRAAHAGHAVCVTELLSLGANPNPQDIEGATPAYWAAENGHTDVLRALAAVPATNLQQCRRDGRAPLHIAVQCGHADSVSFLISAGADPNLEGKGPGQGNTPLGLACFMGHPAVVAVLLAAGADVNAADAKFRGETPFAIATRKGHTQVADLLRRAGGLAQPPAAPAGT
eukprot:TRINITY_DN23433_c0_g1_i1.p1 TRINITY_DN23433_c0_g1~~TRINITY_DN23433_c0_g1_i1.p1  ORF type:complete len:1217 (+),score=319.22 TRINITY_DN23433_c0_g1_i1:87-3653(+)